MYCDDCPPSRRLARKASLQLPTVSIALDKAGEHFGWFAHFAALDMPVQVSGRARRRGFDVEASKANRGLGLVSIQERGHLESKWPSDDVPGVVLGV